MERRASLRRGNAQDGYKSPDGWKGLVEEEGMERGLARWHEGKKEKDA